MIENEWKIVKADTFWKRLKGWMGKKEWNEAEGLLLIPCRSVHTCFMRESIDVIFLDNKGTVVYLVKRMEPWRFSPNVKSAFAVLELPTGSIEKKGIQLGDRLLAVSLT